MIATQSYLLPLLEGRQQFEVPIYQRTYSWSDNDRQQLWQDLLRAGRTPKQSAHFMGSVVSVQPSNSGAGVARARLIDGQQRVTTITLLLIALVERLREKGDLELRFDTDGAENTETISADWVSNTFLINPTVSGEPRYKLLLTYADRATLMHHLSDVPLPDQPSQNIQAGLTFFRKVLRAPGVELQDVFVGLRKLQVVAVVLEQDKDDPQLIFESLNSTGLELSQTDLIRNNLLMDLDSAEQKELYEHYWLPVEGLFRDADVEKETFDRFMRDYLTLRTRSLPNRRHVYRDFKTYRTGTSQKVQALVKDIADRARHYADLVNPARVQDPALRLALQDIAALDVRVSHPFLLEVLEDHAAELLGHDDLLQIFRLVEAFVMRRAVVGLRTSPLNKFFAALGRNLDKTSAGSYVSSVERSLLLWRDQGQEGFPSDQLFQEALVYQPLYQRDVCKQVLVKVERHLSPKEQVAPGRLTIEHILPQNEKLSASWRSMLGEHWQDVQARLMHTLGNLTLTGYNSELGDRPFDEKQTLVSTTQGAPQGYKTSNLRMTRELADEPTWNEDRILSRGRSLAQQALEIWFKPQVSYREVDAFRPVRQKSGSSTVEWHLDGLSPELRSLYTELAQQLLALRPDSREVPSRYHIDFRDDRSFCQVVSVPELNSLKMTLNMPFEQVDDPLHLGRKAAATPYTTYNEMEVVLHPGIDLNAVTALVNQVLEFQRA